MVRGVNDRSLLHWAAEVTFRNGTHCCRRVADVALDHPAYLSWRARVGRVEDHRDRRARAASLIVASRLNVAPIARLDVELGLLATATAAAAGVLDRRAHEEMSDA